MTGKDRTMKDQYAKLKKLHPKAKVGNIKRLIKAIGDAGHWETENLKARIHPLKANGKAVTYGMAINAAANPDAIKRSRIPISFDMTSILNVPRPSYRDLDSMESDSDATCGTAGCIAGFAYVLSARSARGANAMERLDKQYWVDTLADYMGIEFLAADKMTSVLGCSDHNYHVRPRHAVKMLETFLMTGRVDWPRAMGRRKDADMDLLVLTKAEVKKRKEEKAAFNQLEIEVDELAQAA